MQRDELEAEALRAAAVAVAEISPMRNVDQARAAITAYQAALPPAQAFSAWLNAGPRLAKAAGVYVGITVYDKDPTK